MRYTDVTQRVRRAAGDDASLQFSDSDILNWINDAVTQCAVDNNLLQKTASSNLVVGQVDYSLPVDILKLHSIKIDNLKLPIKTLEEFDNLVASDGSESGTPRYAFVWASKLTVFPAPDGVKTLRVDYTYNPAAGSSASSTDELPLPVGYHRRVVDYCLAQVAEQDDDYARYQIKMQEFETGVAKLQDQHETQHDLYPGISVSPEDFGMSDYGQY